jgi:hypothetical protein
MKETGREDSTRRRKMKEKSENGRENAEREIER